MEASGGGNEEIIRLLDELIIHRLGELKAGLEGRIDELKAGQARLETGLESLRVEMRSEFKDLRASTTETHRLLVDTSQALNIASLRTRADVTELQRKVG